MDQDETRHAGRPRPWSHWGPSSPPLKGHSTPIFSPCLLCPNGLMHQDATWYGCRPRRPSHIVLDGDPALSQKRDTAPRFWAHVCCGQTAERIKMPLDTVVSLGPGDITLDGDPAPPKKKGAQPHQFSAHVYSGQTPICIRIPLSTEVGLSRGDIVLDGDPAPLPQKGAEPQFSAHVYCGQMAAWIKMTLGMQIGLGPGHIVLDGDPAPFPKRGSASNFQPMSIVAKRSPISATADC